LSGKAWKIGCKAGFTVQRNRLTFKVGIGVIQNPWRKPLIAFLEVVEGD
jgi:hypothetical protein